MAVSSVSIRPATLADAARLAVVEQQAWPAPLAADEAQIRARITAFPAGQLAAELEGQLVGVAWAQRIAAAQLDERPATFARLTDAGCFTRTHRSDGEVYQLIGVAVAGAGRRLRLGRRLVDEQIALARSLPSVRRIVGFTRPVGFHKHPELSIQQYAQRTGADGRPADPMLAFHLTAGAKLVSLHEGFRPEDAQARGYGALIEYPR